MRLAAALLGAVLAVPSAAEWPWQTTRYYADSGDKADDVSFAGLPLGTGYKTDGLTSCSCDLTADVCDPYCCCDAACSSTERNSLFDCEADANVTFTRAGVYTCADATAVVQANLPDTAKAAWEVDAENPLNRVLCVVGDNSASYGNFIAPLEPLSDSELADYSVAANSSFAGKLAGGTPNPYTNSYYSPGQALNQGTSSGEGASASEYAPVLLPSVLAGGASGGCADFAPIRFLESFSPRSCVTYAALGLSTICSAGSTLDASLFSGLSLGASGLIPGSSDYEKVSVEVASLYFQELGSNERTELDASTVPMPQVNSSVTNSSSTACLNALTGAVLRLRFDDKGRLSAATAYLTISDIPAEATSVERTFGQQWQSDGETDPRPRSGRPGYLRGLPLLSGVAEDKDGAKVTPSISGLTALVYDIATGYCDTDPTLPLSFAAGGGGSYAEVVTFGEDALLSCELGWTQAVLKARCEAGTQFTITDLVDDYIGRYGDSYGSSALDWIALNKPGDAPSPSWDEETLTCSNLVIGASLQFFTAKYGASVDLQTQIIGAKLSLRTGDWRYTSSSKQAYTVTVSFVEVPSGAAAEFVPPMPGLFAPLPDDVFYPFTVTPQSVSTGSVLASSRRAR